MDEQFRQEIRGVFSPPTPMTKNEVEKLRSEWHEAAAAVKEAQTRLFDVVRQCHAAAGVAWEKYQAAVKELEAQS